jgi:hypothetical protein
MDWLVLVLLLGGGGGAVAGRRLAARRRARRDEAEELDGIRRMACVQARVAGRPVPELRAPCFFNPQHGPSARDVQWTAAGRGTRMVPACEQDARRVARGESPDVRQIKVAGTLVDYWDAGAVYLPYSKDYFVGPMLQAGQNLSGPTSIG